MRSVHDDHLARNFNPGVAFTITPESPTILVSPVFTTSISNVVPIGKATAESVGIVTVTGLVESISIKLSLSPNDESV